MNKLKLRIDTLKVESFDVRGATGGRRGTVLGASAIESVSGTLGCLQTRITGPCCEYTFANSCRQTACDVCL